jgi:carbonic anhydrase/acetyltransferase-like protein (isoleucine patch superfamily)
MLRRRSRLLQIALGLVLVIALVFGLAGVVYAADFRSGEEIVIGPDEVIDDDLYVAANRVVVDGTIQGDLYVGAKEVVINGTVEGDLVCGAQFITIAGTVGHNAFVGGMSFIMEPEASIGHNLFFGGFALSAEQSTHVGHDLIMGGYQAQLRGEVAQDVRAGVGAMELAGTVGRNVDLHMGESAQGVGPTVWDSEMPVRVIDPGLRIANSARIGGHLIYESMTRAEIASGAQIQGEVRHRIVVGQVRQPPTGVEVVGWIVGMWLVRMIGTFISLLIVGALVLWLLPEMARRVTAALAARPWSSLGWGCLAEIAVCIGVPVAVLVVIALAIIFGAVTLTQLLGAILGIGLSAVSLFAVLFGLVSIYVTKVVVAVRVGRIILGQTDRPAGERWFWPLLVGVILFVLLRAIPILGAIISFFVTLFGLGAIVLSLRGHGRGLAVVATEEA